jgi:hypothetical protein
MGSCLKNSSRRKNRWLSSMSVRKYQGENVIDWLSWNRNDIDISLCFKIAVGDSSVTFLSTWYLTRP